MTQYRAVQSFPDLGITGAKTANYNPARSLEQASWLASSWAADAQKNSHYAKPDVYVEQSEDGKSWTRVPQKQVDEALARQRMLIDQQRKKTMA